MFWGLSMEPLKRYTQNVAESFHISQATIDITSVAQETNPTQLILEFESNDFLLATLSKNAKIYQVPLDLNFQKGDHVSFRTVGPGIIHLSGYHVFDDDDDLESRLLGGEEDSDEEGEGLGDEEEEVDEDEETGQIVSGPPGKRKKENGAVGKNKKSKLDSDNEESSDEEIDNSLMTSSLLDDDDDDDDDDEDEEIDEEDSDAEDDDEDDSDEEEEQTPPKKKGNKNASLNGFAGKKELQTPKSEGKKNKQEQKSLNKSKQEQKTPKQEAVTPKQEGKTPKDKKTPKTSPQTTSSPSQKKVLEGGVVAEELKVGEGPVAKAGKMAQVYYQGRLKSNNKQFDATTGGPGFKFRLGRGEVIKGWDIGVSGMRVGGKRRLTIPAGLAYGSKGSPPTIPPNATLVFDVELRGIS